MARENAQRVIDGRDYRFTQFTTTISLKVLSRLTRLLAEPLALGAAALFGEEKSNVGSVAGAVDELKKASRKVDKEMIGKAVRALIERLDENEVVDLAKTLATQGVLCDHKPIIFDTHFIGETGHLFKVLWNAVEVQYGNFIGAASAQFGVAAETVPENPIGAM